MCGPDRPIGPAGQRGLTLIELLVAMVVALLVGVAAAATAIVFSASQRQALATGGAVVGATSVLSSVKADLSLAGLGFFGDSQYLCNRLSVGVGPSLLSDAAEFSPVRVTRVGTEPDDDDQIEAVHGSDVAGGANVTLGAVSDGTSARLQSWLPVRVGQAVLLAPKTPGTAPCLVRSVTAVTDATDDADALLSFAASGLHNEAAFGAAPHFDAGDRAALIGRLNWNRYRRVGTNLVVERPIDATTGVLARNVMALRAQYGISDGSAGTLTQWVDASGDFASLGAANLPRVRALRIGIVVRSPQREKPDADGRCTATPELPTLFDDHAIRPDVADWPCYRFRTSIAVVPLRNFVLGTR